MQAVVLAVFSGLSTVAADFVASRLSKPRVEVLTPPPFCPIALVLQRAGQARLAPLVVVPVLMMCPP